MKLYCLARCCREDADPDMLMCGKHWDMVSEKIQNQLIDCLELAEDKFPVTEYRRLTRAAITAVSRAELEITK